MKKNKWTLMVYISADDVLSNFAVESLKQLKRAAGDGVEVFAQFDPNVPGKRPSQYVFSDAKKTEPSIDSNLIPSRLGRRVNMTDAKQLKKFINTATARCQADHYGLVLWGHGPELLFDDDVPSGTPPSKRRYFTPANLREALEGRERLGKASLDIVAVDACCGALVEIASALQGCANYLVASQDEVPDASFPYEQLLERLKPACEEGDVKEISRMLPRAYKEAFVDYISTPANELRGITLSTVDLGAIETMTAPLKELAESLLQASTDATLRRKILDARRKSHAFEFGLFVDLFDFCEKLQRTRLGNRRLTSACESMRAAINNCVIQNEVGDKNENRARCHGLSVYFPYKTNDLIENAVLKKNGTNHPIKDRIGRIAELEKDYSELQMDGQAEWMQFIKQGWSVILAKTVRGQLDTHYSAQQCMKNLLPDAARGIKLTLQPEKAASRNVRTTRQRSANGAAKKPAGRAGELSRGSGNSGAQTGRRKHGSGRPDGAATGPIISAHQYPRVRPTNGAIT